jgi:RNA polymerase sigma-70 factor (ECF subfamily)
VEASVETRGDPTDFESIVRQQSPALIRTLTLVVLDREAAADIAQETFVQLYRHWERVAKHPDLSAWIYRVALNRARDHRRALARVTRLVDRLGRSGSERQPVEPWRPDTEFMDVLRDLPRQQRAAAALHYLGDLSVLEVARIMGLSEGAVKSHLHRARAALRDVLEEQ